MVSAARADRASACYKRLLKADVVAAAKIESQAATVRAARPAAVALAMAEAQWALRDVLVLETGDPNATILIPLRPRQSRPKGRGRPMTFKPRVR